MEMESLDSSLPNPFPEGDNVCLICLQLYNEEEKGVKPNAKQLQYLQDVFDNVSKYLSSEIFENCFQWDFAKEGTSPVCSSCLTSMEKIFKVHLQLVKFQSAIRYIIDAFTSEVLGHHSKLEFSYTNEDVVVADESTSCTSDKDSQQKNKDTIDIKEEPTFEEVELEYGGNYTDKEDDGEGDIHEFWDEGEAAQNDENDVQDPEANEITLPIVNSANSDDKVTSTSSIIPIDEGSSSSPTKADVKESSNIFLKPIRIVLEESANPAAQSYVEPVSTAPATATKLKDLKIILERLQFDSEGNVITRIPRPTRRSARKAGQAATAAVRQIVLGESKANKENSSRKQAFKTKSYDDWASHSESESFDDVSESDDEQISQPCTSGGGIRYRKNHFYEIAKRYSCQDEFCKLSFNFSKDLEAHSVDSKHANIRNNNCKTCSQSFFTVLDLKRHETFHLQNKLFKCKRCRKKFKLKEKLQIHVYRSHIAKLFKCEHCPKRFLRKTNFQQHSKLHIAIDKTLECKICSQQFLWKISLREHMRTVHNEEKYPYTCSLCPKTASSRIPFNRHRVTHFKSRVTKHFPCVACKDVHYVERIWDKCIIKHIRQQRKGFTCAICSLRFKTSKELDDHSAGMKHKNKKSFVCFVCKKHFYKSTDIMGHHRKVHSRKRVYRLSRKSADESNLECIVCGLTLEKYNMRKHMQNHLKKKNLKCKVCGKPYKFTKSLRKHLKSHQKYKDLKCNICGNPYKTISSLRHHLKMHEENQGIECNICGKPLKSTYYLKKHLLTHNRTLQFECNECDLAFNMPGKLERHKLSAHTFEKRVACPQCNMMFKSKDLKNRHVRRTHGSRKICDVCGQDFSNQDQLTAHKRHHTGALFRCSLCPHLKFTQRYKLAHHNKVIHTKEKAYQCETCQKCFNRAGSLKIHIRLHTGERPYSCDKCKKGFPSRHQLLRHTQINHTEKNVICDACGKAFSCTESLKNHSDSVHREKAFLCDFCPYRTTRKDNLTTHIRSHNNDKPYLCTLCGKSCTRKDNFNVHMRWHEKMKSKQEQHSDSEDPINT